MCVRAQLGMCVRVVRFVVCRRRGTTWMPPPHTHTPVRAHMWCGVMRCVRVCEKASVRGVGRQEEEAEGDGGGEGQ